MFCPICKAEYRPGFHHCSDCDVELVPVLPADEPQAGGQRGRVLSGDVRRIWAGDDQSRCLELCEELKANDIPYEVAQNVKSYGRGMSVDWKFELAVSADDELRAKDLLSLPETVVEEKSDTAEEEGDQPHYELPAGDDTPGPGNNRDSYLDPWYPEDATVEVHSKPPSDLSSTIGLALKENRIRVRVDRQEDGSTKYFVLPEDEARAREIVREVVEGVPPN
jgi:hypothetical protein